MRSRMASRPIENGAKIERVSGKGEVMQRIIVAGAILAAECIAGLSGALASEKTNAKALPQDVQIVSDELQAFLTEKGLEYKDSAWPKDLDRIQLDKSRVPDQVVARTTQWLRTMIKSEYLPSDPNDWLIPVRKAKSGYYETRRDPNGTTRTTYVPTEGTDDYLVMRYSVGANRLQVQEDGSAVHLLIDVNEPRLFSSNVEQFITNVLYEFLNYPVEHKGALKFNLKKSTHAGVSIWSGTVDCDFDFEDNTAWAKRTWWSHTYLWTDAKRVYFGLVRASGKPQSPGQGNARAGSRPRFR